MKQRMFNTFNRIFENNGIARLFANIGYFFLRLYYVLVRKTAKGSQEFSSEKAVKVLNRISEKPKMKYEINNKQINAGIDLSIVVPAYNAERFIDECLESVFSQTTDYNYEIIVINDGSTDSTLDKIYNYSKYGQLKIINQENKGFSGARNSGIDQAIGKYIMFLDADDILVNDCIKNMMDAAYRENADIVQGSHYSFWDSGNRVYSPLSRKLIIDKPEKNILNPGYPWAKVYKKNMFDKLRFPLDVWYEDTIVCIILFRMCKRMAVIPEDVYGYRINPNGISQTARKHRKCIDTYWIMEEVLELARENDLPNDDLQYNLFVNQMSTLLYRRISLMHTVVIKSAFYMACDILDSIRPDNYKPPMNLFRRDLEKAFTTRNYKLWKLASFIM